MSTELANLSPAPAILAMKPAERIEWERLVDDLRRVACAKTEPGPAWVDAWSRGLD
jgi:hypothetical protein